MIDFYDTKWKQKMNAKATNDEFKSYQELWCVLHVRDAGFCLSVEIAEIYEFKRFV